MLRHAFCLMILTTPALAQGTEDLCRISSQIAGAAVSERSTGATQDAAVRVITADLEGEAAAYAAAVQPLVDWVYSLPEEQLTDDVASAYEAACLAQ